MPETLAKFRKAGISTWVLTGDKIETAINVGFAAGMISNETQRIYLTSGVQAKLLNQMQDCRELVTPQACLIVSGDAFPAIMFDENLRTMFLEVIKDCKSLISCRMSPKQKADMVTFMKKHS